MKKMFQFGFLLIALTLLPDAFIWWRWVAHWPMTAQMAYGLTSLIMVVAFVAFFTPWMGHNTSVRLFFGSTLCVVLPKLLFAMVGGCLGWQGGLTVVVVALLCVIYGFVRGWLRIVVRQENMVLPDLPPAFDGYRIVQFSDLHAGTFQHHPEFIDRLVRLINEQQADAIVFTGDLINQQPEELLPFVQPLSQLHAPDGVFSVLGNHDYDKQRNASRLCDYERQMGWTVLNDEHRIIERQGQLLAIVGVQNAGSVIFYAHGDLKKAMSHVPESAFPVLLSHTPTHWRREILPTTHITLTLSGHTHGGQMRIGGLSPAMRIYREWGGRYSTPDGKRHLYVSQGLGGTLPFRFLAWPEITVLRLSRHA